MVDCAAVEMYSVLILMLHGESLDELGVPSLLPLLRTADFT